MRVLYGLLLGALSSTALPGASRLVPPMAGPAAVPAISAPASDAVPVDWKMLNDLDLVTGKAPPGLQALDGKRVRIAAFIVPLEDDLQEADEFLLVPYFGACIHTPPPPPNQMIYVTMPAHKAIKIGWWDPVMFEGVIHLKQVDSPYGAVAYEMEGISSSPYTPKKP